MKYVAIYRVSTTGQGKSGLGLEGQKAAVKAHLAPGDKLLAEFTEIETGTKVSRCELEKAVQYCRMTGSTLIFAKFDRLTRNLSALCRLRDTGVKFTAVDNPNASELTVNILISVAQEEARLISERTKTALQAAKARGRVLGGYRGGPVPDVSLSVKARREAADAFAALVGPTIQAHRKDGLSLHQIAQRLTDDGINTAHDGAWTATAVRNVIIRLASQGHARGAA